MHPHFHRRRIDTKLVANDLTRITARANSQTCFYARTTRVKRNILAFSNRTENGERCLYSVVDSLPRGDRSKWISFFRRSTWTISFAGTSFTRAACLSEPVRLARRTIVKSEPCNFAFTLSSLVSLPVERGGRCGPRNAFLDPSSAARIEFRHENHRGPIVYPITETLLCGISRV